MSKVNQPYIHSSPTSAMHNSILCLNLFYLLLTASQNHIGFRPTSRHIQGKTETKNLEIFPPVTSSDYTLLQIKTKLQIKTALKITNYEPGLDLAGGVVQLYDGLGG